MTITAPTADESRAQRWATRAEWPLAGCAVAFLALYTVDVFGEPRGETGRLVSGLMTALYVPFLIDYLVRLGLAERKWRWFWTHPLDLAVVTLPFLQPLRFLRLVALIRILQRAFGDAVRGRIVAYTTFGGFLLLYASSLAEFKALYCHECGWGGVCYVWRGVAGWAHGQPRRFESSNTSDQGACPCAPPPYSTAF